MTSVEVAFKRVPITFRATPEFVAWLDAYMGIHKLDGNKTEAIHKMREELMEKTEQLLEIQQGMKPNGAGAGFDPLVNVNLPEKTLQSVKKALLIEQVRQQARTDAMLKRRSFPSRSYSGSRVEFPTVSSYARSCPKGWTQTKCSQYPCERRPECREEGRT
jgi:hypothetical protein